jgi:hypothetical protein
MKFNLDYKEQEITTKTKYINWSIKGLSLDGSDEIDFFTNREDNKQEMELNGTVLKVDYDENQKPNKISCEYFEIEKQSEKKLTVKLKENQTGKDRVIKIFVGDGNYHGTIDITQSTPTSKTASES